MLPSSRVRAISKRGVGRRFSLRQAGAEAIFPPGTVIADAAEKLLITLHKRLEHSSKAAE